MASGRRILCGAEAFGYGPCALLLTIVRQLRLRGFRCDFSGEGISLELARSSADLFDRILAEPLPTPSAGQYAGILSVLRPEFITAAARARLPGFFVDSLYGNWRWEPSQQAEALAWLRSRPENPSAGLARFDRHLRFFLGHAFAARSFVLRWPKERRHDSGETELRLQSVGAIVDTSYRRTCARDRILISVSGLSSPLVSDARRGHYLGMLARLTADLPARGRPPLVFAVPPDLQATAHDVLPAGCEIDRFAHHELLALLNRAACVLAPAGISTLLECTAYGAPLILLPEQHGGHHKVFQRMAASLDAPPWERFPRILLSDTPQSFEQPLGPWIEATLRELAGPSPPERLDTMKRRLLRAVDEVLADPEHRRAEAQRDAVEAAFGGFQGAREVADEIAARLADFEQRDFTG